MDDISHAKFDHLCNAEDHPLPTKSTKAIAEHLSSRIQHELHTLPTAPGLIISFKTDVGTHPSLKTVYRGTQLGKGSVFGTEVESLCKLQCYLERLVQANPGSQKLFNLDAEGDSRGLCMWHCMLLIFFDSVFRV